MKSATRPLPRRPGKAGTLALLALAAVAAGTGAWWYRQGRSADEAQPRAEAPKPAAVTPPQAPAAPAPEKTPPPVEPEIAPAPHVVVSETSSPAWSQLGAFGIDRRMGHKCPGYGVYRSVDAHPKQPDVVLMGGDTTGVWKSADAGKTWKFVTHGMPVEQVYRIRFAPSDPRAVWAATDKGIAVSPDAGDTWTFTSLSRPDAGPNERMHCLLAVSSLKPSVAIAYADRQLRRTEDAGKTWKTVESDVIVHDLEFHPRNDAFAYALVSRPGKGNALSFLQSEDGGRTFRPVGNPMEFRAIHRASLAVSPARPDSLWFMVFGDRDVKLGSGESKKAFIAGFFRSDNRGRSFAPVKQNYAFKTLPDGLLAYPGYWPDETEKKTYDSRKDDSFMRMGLAQIGWDHALAVSDTDPNLIVAGGTGVCVSRDGGHTWVNKHQGDEIHADIQDAVVRGSRLWVVHDGGLNTVNLAKGAQDSVRCEGYCGQQLWGFGGSFKTGVLASGINHSTIAVHDPKLYENGWYSAGGADAQTAFVNLFDDRWFYGTPWWNEVIRRPLSPTDKAPWRRSAVDFGYIPYRTPEQHPNLVYSFFALHKETEPGNPHKTVAQQVARSDDNFQTITTLWRKEGGYARRLRVQPGNADVMVVISGPDRKVERSSDGGKTWTDITPADARRSYSDVAIDENNADELWLSASGHGAGPKVLRSHDGGKTWTDFSKGIGATDVRTMLLLRGTRGGVYLGCHPGVYYRNDDMDAWVRHDKGLPYADVPFLQADYSVGLLRAGTSQGVWTAPLAQDFAPRSLIAATHRLVTPSATSVKFFCHSALPSAGGKWSWSFPGGTPAESSEENPVVSYAAAKPGEYPVELRVTDAKGRVSASRLKAFIKVGAADTDLGKLKDVLLAVDDPRARTGVENSLFLARKLDEQDEASFARAEAERKALKHRARWELFGEADDDSLRFERPAPVSE